MVKRSAVKRAAVKCLGGETGSDGKGGGRRLTVGGESDSVKRLELKRWVVKQAAVKRSVVKRSVAKQTATDGVKRSRSNGRR